MKIRKIVDKLKNKIKIKKANINTVKIIEKNERNAFKSFVKIKFTEFKTGNRKITIVVITTIIDIIIVLQWNRHITPDFHSYTVPLKKDLKKS